MIKNFPEIPEQLLDLYDDHAQKVYEKIAGTSSVDFLRDMPASQLYSLSGGGLLRYALLGSKEGMANDNDLTLVFSLPHAKTWDKSPASFVIAETVRQIVDPNARMIVLPNNNVGEQAYDFTNVERAKIAKGDLTPITEKDLELIHHLGAKSLLTLGYSFGAMRMASLAGNLGEDFRLQGAVLLGMPNVVSREERGPISLRAKFASQKKHIIPEVNKLFVPALSEFEHTRGWADRFRFELGLLKYTLGGNLTSTNNALNNSILSTAFFDDVSRIIKNNKDTKIILGSATDDPVSPIEPVAKFVKQIKEQSLKSSVEHVIYDGNHITHSSPFMLGLLARKLLNK